MRKEAVAPSQVFAGGETAQHGGRLRVVVAGAPEAQPGGRWVGAAEAGGAVLLKQRLHVGHREIPNERLGINVGRDGEGLQLGAKLGDGVRVEGHARTVGS